MSTNIEKELDIITTMDNDITKINRNDAFTILSLIALVLERKKYTQSDIDQITVENLTNGSRDGGIDAAYLDSDTQVLAVLQTKYSSGIDVNSAVEEIRKIIRTLQRFHDLDTVDYSKNIRKNLRELLDSASDTDELQFKIIFVSTSTFDNKKVLRLLKQDLENFEFEIEIEFVDEQTLENKLIQLKNSVERIKESDVNIESANQFVRYDSKEMHGAFTNVWASSIYRLYEKYSDNGLFNLNVRKYIARKSIDEGIIETIRSDSKDFWFLNNGLTIGASDYDFDGNVLRLYDFSIVNGAQTTSLIGKNFKKDFDFLVPVKIIAPSEDASLSSNELEDFFTQIAESTNSQKPISPRDLKANSREMRVLIKWLKEDFKVDFRVKQGVKVDGKATHIIWNDQFAKIIESFIYQRPGFARSNAKSLFENKDVYKGIFINTGFDQFPNKRQFAFDLIDLNDMYDRVISSDTYNKNDKSFLKQAKMTMFSIFGLIYRFENNLIDAAEVSEFKQDTNLLKFTMSGFISKYNGDDLEANLRDVINNYFVDLQEKYNDKYDANEVTSVSNFFKLDSAYTKNVMPMVHKEFMRMENRSSLNEEYKIFNAKLVSE